MPSSSSGLKLGLALLVLLGSSPGATAIGGADSSLLLDDFEDGDRLTAMRTGWVLGGNPATVGRLTLESNPVVGPGGGRRLELHARLSSEPSIASPWVTLSCGVPAASLSRDGARACGIAFRFSGSPSTRCVLQAWTPEMTDGCHFEVELPRSDAADVVHVRWQDFRQPRWGCQVGSLDPALINGLAWMAQGSDGVDACLTIDDVYLEMQEGSGACPVAASARGVSTGLVGDLQHLREIPRAKVRLVPRRIDLAEATRLRVDFTGPVPVVEVRLNGKGPFRLAFDTGSEMTVLTQEAVARLGLEAQGRVRVQGAARDSSSTHAIVHLDELAMGGLVARDLDVGVMELVGPPARGIDGMMGISAVDGLLVTLDGPAAELRLERGRLPIAQADVVGWGEGLLPAIPIDVGGAPKRCLLDSGSGGLLYLTDADIEGLGLAQQLRPVGWLSPADGRVRHDRRARWDGSISFSGTLLERPILGSGAHRCRIGTEVFREAVTTFDTRSRRVRVARSSGPIISRPAMTAGFYVEWRCGRCVVADVLPGSAADSAGLVRGAFVSSLDGVPVEQLGEEGVRERLRSDAPARVGLDGGREVTVARTIAVP